VAERTGTHTELGHHRPPYRHFERPNKRLAKVGAVPLPEGLSPHKLRHTFASLLVALGTDPGAVMDQLGHDVSS
jgi:integrase